ncbi:RES family NAD+ phosphorylase [Pseudaminobacter sp. NGMCC 1.201702]|uniref:RES family NAD+ phosphorylase n=1 Tax=Pseudaminobacter sp. NGMCC 1.201702 TaxID=3391825 RepID=UPI0039EEA70A
MIDRPPHPFPASNTYRLASGAQLHQVHDRQFAANGFNPGLGRRSRFAPLELPTGKIPTQYAGTSFECAVHETIFHDIPFDQPDKTVGTDSIKPLNHAVVRIKRELVLVPLFAPDLAKWNITRQDLIDTTAFFYPVTSQWALAIHQSRRDADGLVWTSKRCDPDLSFLFFGDRVDDSDIQVIESTSIWAEADEMADLRDFADRSDIVLVL